MGNRGGSHSLFKPVDNRPTVISSCKSPCKSRNRHAITIDCARILSSVRRPVRFCQCLRCSGRQSIDYPLSGTRRFGVRYFWSGRNFRKPRDVSAPADTNSLFKEKTSIHSKINEMFHGKFEAKDDATATPAVQLQRRRSSWHQTNLSQSFSASIEDMEGAKCHPRASYNLYIGMLNCHELRHGPIHVST